MPPKQRKSVREPSPRRRGLQPCGPRPRLDARHQGQGGGPQGHGRRRRSALRAAGAALRRGAGRREAARCCSSSRAWTPPARAGSCGTSSARSTRRACPHRVQGADARRSRRTTSSGGSGGRCRAPGQIGVFDRSHYEDVLVVRVHGLVPAPTWEAPLRDDQPLRAATSSTKGTTIVKVMLHISRDEQKAAADASGSTARTSTGSTTPTMSTSAASLGRLPGGLRRRARDGARPTAAPWFVVPADHKWYARWAVYKLLLEHLEELDPLAGRRLRRRRRAASTAGDVSA